MAEQWHSVPSPKLSVSCHNLRDLGLARSPTSPSPSLPPSPLLTSRQNQNALSSLSPPRTMSDGSSRATAVASRRPFSQLIDRRLKKKKVPESASTAMSIELLRPLRSPKAPVHFSTNSSAELPVRSDQYLGGSKDLLRSENYKTLLGKSSEQLPQMNSEVGPFRKESGSEYPDGEPCPSYQSHALLENPESETRWYFKYFLGKVHVNYLGYDAEKSPFFLSVVPCDTLYRCILWRKHGNKRLCVKPSSSGKWPSAKSILEKVGVTKCDKNLKEVAVATIQKDLLTLEEQEGSVNFKFGVLYAKAGQKTDDEMFSNERGSTTFSVFLELLGDDISLEGWQLFKGGLDNKTNTTGTRSVYTAFEGHEVMFHVSTMLPFSVGNLQQLERKRHIGNDIVVIIFFDCPDHQAAVQSARTFNPACIRSHFNHVFVLVTFDRKAESYHVIIQSAESVPTFAPALPPNGEFTDHVAFRDFLLAKLINGEKAAYCTPTFAEKRRRTLDLLLKGVEKKCSSEYRRATSTPSLHSPNQSKKAMEKEQSFTDFGQRLKVEKIITGHHPTSQRTTVAPKKNPWETVCLAEDFPYQITCGDACDDGTLIVTTQSDGTYFIFKDGSYSLALDKSVVISQLVVAHRHQVLLFTTGYSKEANYLYALPLRELYSESIKMSSRPSLSPYLLPYTKGCHIFCTAPLDGQFLRIAVAVKNKVSMLAYKHPAVLTVNGSPITPLPSPHPLESFIKHRELSLPDVPVQMTLLDERPSGKLCVTYLKQSGVVDAVDEIKGTTQRIPHPGKGKLTTLSSIHSNGRSELLVGYNLTSQLITLHDGTAYNSIEIVWNAEPKRLVYTHPYILAFTASTVEIRMAANGSLMQTINVPNPHLFSKKGDLYFASSMLLPNCRSDSSKQLKPDVKMPKNIDKKAFTASDRFDESDGMQFIYKITLANMTGRRDSITSTSSAQFTQSVNLSISEDAISTTSAISEELPSDSSSLDYVHPIVGELESPPPISFGVGDSPPPESHEKRPTRRVWVYPSTHRSGNGDSVFDTSPSSISSISSSRGGPSSSSSTSILQEHTLSSSPDSGVQDDFSMSGGHYRARTLAVVDPPNRGRGGPAYIA